MKIRGLQIRGFGHFADLQVDPFPDGLVLIEGANEAGKTTLMSFVKAILFGFADRRTNQLRYEPLRGGEHGGSITLESQDGCLYRVERRPGPSRGEVTIYHPDGVWHGEDRLKKLLQGLSEPLFQQIFCFGLDELQHLESLQSEEITGLIYSAGMGTSHRRSYLQMQKELTDRQGQLYKPTGKNPQINQLLQSLEMKEGEMRELQQIPGTYNHLQEELARLTDELAEMEDCLSQLEGEASWLQRLKQASEPFYQLEQVTEELGELSEVGELPEDGIHRLERLKEARQELQEVLARKEREKASYLSEIEEITIQSDLLAAVEQIRELVEERRLFQDWLKQEGELHLQLQHRQQEVKHLLRELGSEWDPQRVQDFPLTYDRWERVQEFDQQLAELRRRKEELESEARQLASLQAERELEVQEQEARSRAIFSRRQAHGETKTGDRMVVVGGVMTLTLLGLAGWLSVTASWLTAGVAAVLGLISGGGAIYLRQFLQQQAEEAKEQRQEEMTQAREELAVKEQGLDRVVYQLRDLNGRLDQIQGKQGRLLEEWEEFLVENKISLKQSPAELLELFKRLEKGQELLGQWIEEKNRYRRLVEQIDLYLEQGNRLLAQLQRSEVEAAELPLVIMQIQEEWLAQEKQHTRYERLHEKVSQVELELADLAFQLEAKEADWADLLSTADTDNEVSFRQRWVLHQERAELQKAQRQWETAFQSIAVGQAQEMEQALQEWDLASVRQRLAEVEEERQEVKNRLANCQDQRGRYQARIETMEHSESLAILRQEREELQTEIRERSEDWLALALCQRLLERAKERYEQERQPGVLRQASAIFEQLTAGEYRRVVSPLGEDQLQVEKADGSRLAPESLSRGTAEQLYLAMRLALAKEYSSRTLGLPLVMDDIFVNFDPERTQAGLKVLHQLAQEEQVVFFTCHPHLAEYLDQAGLTYRRLRLVEYELKEV